MKTRQVVAAKNVRGYCDFCGINRNLCSHCISVREAGFREVNLEQKESFYCDTIEFFTILFVVSGSTSLSAPNGCRVDIAANSMILFSKGDIVRITACEKSHIVLFEFSTMPDFCERIRLQSFKQFCPCEYDYTPTPMESNVQTFLEECLFFMHHNMLCRKFSTIKQSEFFYLISVIYTPQQLASFLHPIIGRAMDFRAVVLQNYSPSMSAVDLMKRIGYERNTFYVKFRREFDMPVKEWIVKQRVKQMRIIAMEPDITAKEMMYRCGFSSSGNFAKYCKHNIGMTAMELINSYNTGRKTKK